MWKVYRDEATAHDATMLDGWNKSLDILLIFVRLVVLNMLMLTVRSRPQAALFSAVATAFLIESYKLLQPDSADYMSATLYAILVAINNSSTTGMVPAPPSAVSNPTAVSRWINGLWFTSLFSSLAVSLLCILVKQWLSEYSSRIAASSKNPRHWAHRRGFYFQGITAWRLSGFISLLPVGLHFALFLFFAGLGLFLWTLDRAVGIVIVSLSGCLVGFYTVATLVPLWRPESPTATPAFPHIYPFVTTLQSLGLHLYISILKLFHRNPSNREINRFVHSLPSAEDPDRFGRQTFIHILGL